MPFISYTLKLSAGYGTNSTTRDCGDNPDVPPPPAVTDDKEEPRNGNENNTGGKDPSPCGCQADETAPTRNAEINGSSKDNNHCSSGCERTSKNVGGAFLPSKQIGSFDTASKQEIFRRKMVNSETLKASSEESKNEQPKNDEIQSSKSPASPSSIDFDQKPILDMVKSPSLIKTPKAIPNKFLVNLTSAKNDHLSKGKNDNDLPGNSNFTVPRAPHQMTGPSSVKQNCADKNELMKSHPVQLNGPSMNQARGEKRSWNDQAQFSPQLEETERKRLKNDSDEMVVMKTNTANTLNHNEDSLQIPNHAPSMNIDTGHNNENKNGECQPKSLFTNSDQEISTVPSLEDINSQITNAGDYHVYNLTVKHARYGEIEFLGFRNLQFLGPEMDISNLVSFKLGGVEIRTPVSFQKHPMQLTFYNMTRQDFAREVGATREIRDRELDSIVIRMSQCFNAASCQYNETQKKWVVLIVDDSRYQYWNEVAKLYPSPRNIPSYSHIS